ncbi:thiamine diphosphokinase [Sporosarcina sp. ANT_H38]|uniref:thiamine diphosphokinase n=1 Tax=Sporosarcina sp. ANT_H38 TaxID=2597358 RepID=UPI0011F28B2F|nr:thiamine diphosphokinase [Sporosarcina sp. ANT_H38]KAA0966552.1 thiamine diphosphokinase [Sporosarcina sp. ANT_H38]
MKYAVVCAGGPDLEIADLTGFQHEDTVFIGADRGALHLLRRGIVPLEAVGDFDSVTESEYDEIATEVRIIGRFRSEKNETDTELAVERALSYRPEHVILTGVTGGRLDHMESALHLLYRLQTANKHTSFSIRNGLNELSIIIPGIHQVMRNDRFKYISFFSFGGAVSGLTLTGFKYDMVDAVLETGMTLFTSNELAAEVCTISLREGICLMVRSSDS